MSIGSRLRFGVLRRDGFRCRYCGRSSAETKLHIDHVTPRADGGSDDIDNLISACVDCNLGKGVVDPTSGGIPAGDRLLVSVAASPGLVGKCFVIFNEYGNVNFAGVVRERITKQSFLVQMLEWFGGTLTVLMIVNLESMICLPRYQREEGSWMFFEDHEHLIDWMEHKYRDFPEPEDELEVAVDGA